MPTSPTAQTRALIVIDLQNDYFPAGKFPLWQSEETLNQVLEAIRRAQAQQVPVILVQHVADSSKGIAPFFNPDTEGVALHPQVQAAAPDAPVIVKQFADSFLSTTLQQTLHALGVNELLLCGMMTQNCVTHTALAKAAETYQVTVIADCCTTVSEMIHKIALNALAPRVPVVMLNAALPA